jgi:hypothetical protein
MDHRAFGHLSKRVAAAETRRGTLRALVVGLAAGLSGGLAGDEAVEAAFGFCHAPGTPCSRDKKCCSGTCRGGACGCLKKGKPCISRVGIACCSQKCKKGKCK